MNEVKVETQEQTMAAKPPPSDATQGSRFQLIVCFCGIFFSYLIFGLLQEKVTKGEYGPDKERFKYTLALVFFQCFINAAFAKIAMFVKKPDPDTTPQKSYALMTFSYVLAMLASNHALQYVSYPTQVLGKSVKPIPILILGVLFAHKRYPLAKYFCVLLIVTGVALFIYKDKKGSAVDADHTMGFGEILLLVSLLADGMTGAVQDRTRASHHTQTYPMMINMNLWSLLYLGTLLVVTGEGVEFSMFGMKYPEVFYHLLMLSFASALGQNFIFMTVTTFGPLTCSIITTTRKFFTILGSVIIFQNPMSSRQWIGTVFVFAGLGLDSVYGKEKKDKMANVKRENSK